MSRWKIRKERIYLREEQRWSAHKAWSLYFGQRRVARYVRWEMCLEHIRAYYAKFGDIA